MNERIQELVKQAGFFGCMDEGVGLVFRKFAELIVRDCMDIAANIGEHGPVAAQEMRELFGVEDA